MTRILINLGLALVVIAFGGWRWYVHPHWHWDPETVSAIFFGLLFLLVLAYDGIRKLRRTGTDHDARPE